VIRKLLHAVDVGVLRGALAEIEPVAPELVAELGERLEPERITRVATDDMSLELRRQLEAAPQDRALLQVLADHLQELGHERGELIALQLADGAGEARVAELRAALLPQFAHDAAWGIGFLAELTQYLGYGPLGASSGPLLHESSRLLHRLTLWGAHREGFHVDLAQADLPRSLRVLEVRGGLIGCDLSRRLPHLERLVLDRCGAVAHATVTELELVETDRDTIEACARGLPAVRRLELVFPAPLPPPPAELGALLVGSGWMARLDELHLRGVSRDLLGGAPRRYPHVRVTVDD
jgi:hypothetical protein